MGPGKRKGSVADLLALASQSGSVEVKDKRHVTS